MVTVADEVQLRTERSFADVCRELALPYRSVQKWRKRLCENKPPLQKPGPCKVEPFDLAGLEARIREKISGRKRTAGMGGLYEEYRSKLSRRDLQSVAARLRAEVEEERQANMRCIEWLTPSLVWSMDDTEITVPDGGKVRIHMVHDLGSRYTLSSAGSRRMADGVLVAENLERLFLLHGPPLFLKMDNGSNLNHHAVLAVLEKYGVIPLVSPPYYPPYNGAVEKKQSEFKLGLRARRIESGATYREYELHCELVGHELNHRRRRVLGRRTACGVLENGKADRKFTMRERREVLEEIENLTVDLTGEMQEYDPKKAAGRRAGATAFRYAVETWMQLNNIIRVKMNGVVLPAFYKILSR